MNIFESFKEVELKTSDWGVIKLLIPQIGKDEDPWGNLSLVKDTVFESYISVVSKNVYEQATYGWGDPLMGEVGPEPRLFTRKMPLPDTFCSRFKDKTCILAQETCYPNKDVPECYEFDSEDWEKSYLITRIVLAWKENRRVVVIKDG